MEPYINIKITNGLSTLPSSIIIYQSISKSMFFIIVHQPFKKYMLFTLLTTIPQALYLTYQIKINGGSNDFIIKLIKVEFIFLCL
jgi:hypothetical protein